MAFDLKTKTEENLIIAVLILLVAFIIVTVTFSLYLFIESTNLTDEADVHVTKNLVLASKDVQGKLLTDESAGIFNWYVFEDEKNGFRIAYPNDWVLASPDDDKHELVLKKYNAPVYETLESLAAVIYVTSKVVPENISLRDAMIQDGIAWNNAWQQREIGGKPGIATGLMKHESGSVRDAVYWRFADHLFILEADYFSESEDVRKTAEKIMQQFNFL